jgi:hypothetical protein
LRNRTLMQLTPSLVGNSSLHHGPKMRGTDAIKRSVLAKARRRRVRCNANLDVMAGDLVSCADRAHCRHRLFKLRGRGWVAADGKTDGGVSIRPRGSLSSRICWRSAERLESRNQCLRVGNAPEVHSLDNAGFGKPVTGKQVKVEDIAVDPLVDFPRAAS